MERLTKYDEFGNAEFVGIDNTKLYERLVCDETVALTIVTNKLGELEDVLEKYGIENLEGYISALIEARNIAIDEKKTQFKKYIEEVAKRENLEQELAELKQKAIVPKEDKFVIVSNAWKHNKKYGIAKVKQIMTDHYILQTDDYLGTYVTCIQFGEFKTLEEAEQKLAEIKGEKDE